MPSLTEEYIAPIEGYPGAYTTRRRISRAGHWVGAGALTGLMALTRGMRARRANYLRRSNAARTIQRRYRAGRRIRRPMSFCSSYGTLTTTETTSCTRKQRLNTIKSMIDTALSEEDSSNAIIESVADEYFDVWVSHYRAFENYIRMKTKPRDSPVEVHILQGPTGTGKSKWCMETYPDAYWKQRSNWWDGYTGQKVVVIDEFYGWLPYDLLLRVCDRYPLLVETKGGQAQFVATTIVITTNMVPSSWYKNAYFPALARRVGHWHVLPVWGFHTVYHSWAEASKHMIENVNIP